MLKWFSDSPFLSDTCDPLHPPHGSPQPPGPGSVGDDTVCCRGGPAPGPGPVHLLQPGVPIKHRGAGGLRPLLPRHLHRVQSEDRREPSSRVREALGYRRPLSLLQRKGWNRGEVSLEYHVQVRFPDDNLPQGWVVGPQLLEDSFYITTLNAHSQCPAGNDNIWFPIVWLLNRRSVTEILMSKYV